MNNVGIEGREEVERVEIVAMRITTGEGEQVVSNDLGEIFQAIGREYEMDFITRSTAEHMVEKGFGNNWQGLVDAPALFFIDEEGNLYSTDGMRFMSASE